MKTFTHIDKTITLKVHTNGQVLINTGQKDFRLAHATLKATLRHFKTHIREYYVH